MSSQVVGDALTDADRTEMARRVACYTGLSPEYVLSTNLRIDTQRFWKELLRDQRLTVGRLDSRYLGVDKDAAGETPGYDPDIRYNSWGNVRPWVRDEGASVGEMLREAMRDNPYMKVLIQGGYFDAATDYFSAVYTISHIQPGGEFRDRFRFAWYESGHMMYLRQEDLKGANQDLREFIQWSMDGDVGYPRTVRPGG